MTHTSIVWFRLDLRLQDNPALAAAAASGGRVIPVFIWAPEEEGDWPPGAASRWWLLQSLKTLTADLQRKGSRLVLRRGPSLDALRSLVRECGADAVFWNRRYEPALRRRDLAVQQTLQKDGVRVETFNSALLIEPEKIKNRQGKPYQVFTPFWRSCLSAMPDFSPEPLPAIPPARPLPSLNLEDFHLVSAGDWTHNIGKQWQPGEAGAQMLFHRFLESGLDHYPTNRDLPALYGTSRLSPHLHFGEISPHRIRALCAQRRDAASRAFIRQLGWREFAHHLLYNFPETPSQPLRTSFAGFPWRKDRSGLRAWQQGRTGFPIVDAGMRELLAAGWMHNRVRMIAGSFLVKDLLLSWTEGARWFWDRLVDADLANNTLGWQWVAGCGADAAPYFRIFNPAVQQNRFDPSEEYVRHWIPEWHASGYPAPIVDHNLARDQALDALAAMKNKKIR